LPDNKTQSGIKSNTSKGGNGYNEFMFEDAKDSEKIRLHAQKDLNSTILHAETREIGEKFETASGSPSRKTTLKMGDDELEISSGNQKVHIAQKQTIDAGNDITITSMTTITLKVGANQVVIDQSGVHINGMTIDLKGGIAINETAPMIKLN
jgi:type VI secretion system secreted protein VgrG